jgi:hypothetical protein
MREKKTSFGRTIRVATGVDDISKEAYHHAQNAWEQALLSHDLLLEAEDLFAERTEAVKKKLGVKTLTVEAVIERKLDERWQTSVADSQYHMARMAAFAALANTATQRAIAMTNG